MEIILKVEFKAPIVFHANGDYFFINTKYGRKFANKTSYLIILKLQDNEAFENVILYIMKILSIDYIPAKKHLYHILSELQLLELIDFDPSEFEDISGINLDYNLVGESEYVELSKFILAQKPLYDFAFNATRQYYNAYSLRSRGFYNKENYFYDSKINGLYENIIGISNYKETKQPLVINYLYSSNIVNLSTLYSSLESKFKNDKKFKIKIIIPESKKNSLLFDFLKGVDFFNEAKLMRENGKEDYLIYSKLI